MPGKHNFGHGGQFNSALREDVETLKRETETLKREVTILKKYRSDAAAVILAIDRIVKAIRESKGDMTAEQEQAMVQRVAVALDDLRKTAEQSARKEDTQHASK